MKYTKNHSKGRGRKMYYESPESLQTAIDLYFNNCKGELIFNDKGQPIFDDNGCPRYRNRRPMTMSGLALSLGFTSRRAFLNYKYRPEYSGIYLRALTRCEEYAETMLFSRDGYAGAAYILRQCYGWKQPEKPIPVTFIFGVHG